MEIILLNAQPDFAAQKEWLEETVESSGHEIIFLPKFHPELSFIEMMWEFVKTQLRRSCTFTPIYMLFPQALWMTSLLHLHDDSLDITFASWMAIGTGSKDRCLIIRWRSSKDIDVLMVAAHMQSKYSLRRQEKKAALAGKRWTVATASAFSLLCCVLVWF